MFRILRATKNRFGNASEIGVFQMEGDGLKEVSNPSEIFLAERHLNACGSAVGIILEGNRPLVIEVQSLVVFNKNQANPTMRYNGLDRDRASLVTSVINKHLPYASLSLYDTHASVVGGLRVRESSVDVSLAMSLISSRLNVSLPPEMVFIGELGLTGELRRVIRLDSRLKEAYKLGFKTAVIPPVNQKMDLPKGMKILSSKTLDDAVKQVFGNKIEY
jgi:DNA repair protein RadA/Sms